ncbi:expressed unknown protein [Seminavis robusta]|uniref:Uncharacterized protein n=1 Tax=Seminavis robusta TaxID=568900 RepID=A0A9N8H821_9STRA|nr:expressed unknown protein [Seminavis robusta]|eukprot:Sro223_g091290.1 n/a (299) ;mRNA; r:11254-12256
MGVSVDSSYFRRLSLCETISRTLQVYKTGLWVFCQLSLLTLVVYALISAAALMILMPALGMEDGADQMEDPEYLMDHFASFYILMGVDILLVFLIGAVGNGAYVRAVADITLQQDPVLKNCIQVGFQHARVVLTASFVGGLGVMVGCILLYVPGVYLMVRWFLVNPVIVVEGLGAMAALKRSGELVSGSWCYVFCTYMVSALVLTFLQLLWKGFVNYNLFTPLGSLVGHIPSVLGGPFLAIMMTIMYINLRVEKEGLNAELFARNLGESDGGNPGETSYSSLISKDEEEVVTVTSETV